MSYFKLENSTKIILKVIFAFLALALFWVIRDILILALMAIIIASALEPMVDYLHKNQKIPRAVSVLAVYIVILSAVFLVVYLLIPPLAEQLKLLAQNFPEYAGQLQNKLNSPFFSGVNLPDLAKSLVQNSSSDSTLLSKTFGVFSGFFSFITVLVISFYLVAEEQGLKTFISTVLPENQQEFTLMLLGKIQKKMGLWVLGQLILSLFIFTISFVGLLIIGVKYALFLALLAGLLEVVPYIGPFVSAVPAVIVAYIQNPALALAVIILYIIIQKTEGYVLVPKVMQKTVGTSPLVVLLSLLIGFKLAGILGILLAVPVASAITVIIQEVYSNARQESLPAG